MECEDNCGGTNRFRFSDYMAGFNARAAKFSRSDKCENPLQAAMSDDIRYSLSQYLRRRGEDRRKCREYLG